jgi:hypothetical protein
VRLEFIFALFLCMACASDSFASQKCIERDRLEPAIVELSHTIDEFRSALGIVRSQQSIYLIGGTARGLLLTALYSEALKIKDIDIAVVDAKASKERIELLSQVLEDSGFGNKKQIGEMAWVIGWGFFHTHNLTGALIDFVITPESQLLHQRNGLTNIERVKIEIPYNLSLLKVLGQILEHWNARSRDVAISSLPFVFDPDQGLKAWREVDIKVVLGSELAEVPTTTAMRLMLMHMKLGQDMPRDLKHKLRQLILNEDITNKRSRASRHFTYFFDDYFLGRELKLANELGVLEKIAPSAKLFVDFVSVGDLDQLIPFDAARGPLSAEEYRAKRFQRFLSFLSLEDRQLLVRETHGFYPQLTSLDSEQPHTCWRSLFGQVNKPMPIFSPLRIKSQPQFSCAS